MASDGMPIDLAALAPGVAAEQTDALHRALQAALEAASRREAELPQRYWYPQSLPNYGIEEVLSVVESLCSYRTTMSKKVSDFESRFAEFIGTTGAVMVNSGSSADLLITFAMTNKRKRLLEPGDEILVPSVTWPTQIWSAMMAGLKVRLVDTDPETFQMDLGHLRSSITPRTRAISLVHLMGSPVDMDAVLSLVRRLELVLIEDCCESLGATFDGRAVGTFGLASAFSFFFPHHITTMEGGMVCTDEPDLVELFRVLRAHGWSRSAVPREQLASGLDSRFLFVNWGFNVRPTELQGGFGLEQIRRLPLALEARRHNVEYFAAFLARYRDFMRLIQVHSRARASWPTLPMILTDDCPFSRDEFLGYLERQGVETRPVMSGNIARQPVRELFEELAVDDLRGADIVHTRGFFLGVYPFDSRDRLDRLAATFDQFLRRYV